MICSRKLVPLNMNDFTANSPPTLPPLFQSEIVFDTTYHQGKKLHPNKEGEKMKAALASTLSPGGCQVTDERKRY